MKRWKKWKILQAVTLCSLLLSGCVPEFLQQESHLDAKQETITLEEVPEYSGQPYVEIEDNVPEFEESELTSESFEEYSELDKLGRCGTAYANVSEDTMPTEERGAIGQVKPSGWHTVKYDNVEGKYLYNRCHLIGYQLTAENANEENLITGTRYMNTEGMLPFENEVADYVEDTGNHVLYRVTPVFDGDDLVAAGVQMEALSVEDQGEGIEFNVFVYNVQPGIEVDYKTGESKAVPNQAADTVDTSSKESTEIRANSHSMIYHCPGQMAYDMMEHSKYLVVFDSEEEAAAAGYRKAKR